MKSFLVRAFNYAIRHLPYCIIMDLLLTYFRELSNETENKLDDNAIAVLTQFLRNSFPHCNL